jgi:hypothetical protein
MRVGGLRRSVSVTETETGCDLRLPGAEATVTASISGPAESFVHWDYPGPRPPESQVVHCSVADLSVRVERAEEATVELSAPGRAAYEFGRGP